MEKEYPNLPVGTAAAVRLGKLLKQKDNQMLSDRMSSRMVKSASVLPDDAFMGWQMEVPRRGRVRIILFGSEAVSRDDLEWMSEKAGTVSRRSRIRNELSPALSELYEIALPVADKKKSCNEIGIGASGKNTDEEFAKWPLYFSDQFAPLLEALQNTGAAMRAVVCPVTAEERRACMKNTLYSFDSGKLDVRDYVGNPVRIRVLLRLPGPPSIRLRTVMQEAVAGSKLCRIGSITDPSAAAVWDSPCIGAPVLPDRAARILMLEPDLKENVIGIELCEEKAKPIPATHKNPADKNAVVIGSAMDVTGVKRKISIGDLDLCRHYQIVGQTGTGKSTLLASLILSAIQRGHGLTFFDPHGTTIDTILRALPEQYADRVQVVRIGDAANPVPLNFWDSGDFTLEERNISDLCELFADIFDPKREGIVGPRYERWMTTFAKCSLAFLGRRASLESIAVISQNQHNMRLVYNSIYNDYPELAEIVREEYGTDNSSDKASFLNWLLSKFTRLTAVEQLRKTLGAGANALDFSAILESDKAVLIDLASPVIGTHQARIVGTLTLMKLWNAALNRKSRDRTHLVVLDEAALFQTNPLPRMLAESRKFSISLVLCSQYVSQFSREVRDSLEANSANLSAFRLSPRDAETAAIRFDDPSMQISLTRLDAFRAITSLSVNGLQTAPFTLEIRRPRPQKNGEEIAARIEARSIETLVEPYRKMRALTSAEIADLLNHPEKRSKYGITTDSPAVA